ncbi:MAG TPA: amidophosphoribosyltransferase, partial [Ruminococcaceae bacterium]|nr:amidophosphoribosyltransferase [Oscillospiraceae bacterium]
RDELNQGAAIFQSNGHTEIIAYLIARARITEPTIEQAVLHAMQRLKGAYALALMSPSKLIGVRDPMGIRPLCYGKIGSSYVIASESCVFDSMGGEFIRDIAPGEMLVIDSEGVHSYTENCGGKTA